LRIKFDWGQSIAVTRCIAVTELPFRARIETYQRLVQTADCVAVATLNYRELLIEYMGSQPTTDTQQQHSTGHSRHKALFERCPEAKRGVERREERVSKEAKVNYLRKKYLEEFPLREPDLYFVGALGRLEIDGKIFFEDPETGERITRDHYITEGHRWLVDFLNPNIELLEKLELIGAPHINGEPRERIIRRRYWNLTPSGRDLVDRTFSGENIGDTGENVVHRIGMHLVRWWCEEKWDWTHHMDFEKYPTIEGAEMDYVVWNKGGYQNVQGDDVDKHPLHLWEVETGFSDWGDLEGDVHKMAYLRGKGWWVFPNREVLVEVLTQLTMRGYTGLDEVPETLAMRNHRDTYTKRLADAEREMTELNHPPVEKVVTFEHLVDDLKDWRPELFYGPKDSR